MHLVCSADLEHPCSTVNKFPLPQNSELAAVAGDNTCKFKVDSAVGWGGRKAPDPTCSAVLWFFKTAPCFEGGFTVDIEK